MEAIYHIDINGTVIGFDTTDTHSIKEAVIECMGRNINIDIVTSAESNISIYEQFKKLYPKEYKEKNTKFILDLIKDEKYEKIMESLIISFENGIFPSVIKLLASVNIKIVFRTFGLDGPIVVKQLQKFYPYFTFVNMRSIWANDVNYLQYENEIYPMNELNVLIKTFDKNTHVLMQDNYEYWNKKGKDVTSGKCIYGTDCPVFGFDDNRRERWQLGWILQHNPCMYACGFDAVAIFRVNTIKCALDENYLYDLVEKSGLKRKMVFVTPDGRVF
jgi:hypothetical protein